MTNTTASDVISSVVKGALETTTGLSDAVRKDAVMTGLTEIPSEGGPELTIVASTADPGRGTRLEEICRHPSECVLIGAMMEGHAMEDMMPMVECMLGRMTHTQCMEDMHL